MLYTINLWCPGRSCLHALQLWGKRVLGVLALKMLLEGLGIWHLRPADGTCEHQRRFCRSLLVVGFGFLDLCLLLGVFLLRLDFLVSTSHAG